MNVKQPDQSSFNYDWTDEELYILSTLMIRTDDQTGLFNDTNNPPGKNNDLHENNHQVKGKTAALGHKFFFDTRLSGNGKVSCASCHQPSLFFTDGKPLSRIGNHTTKRHTPTVVGVSESPWFFWDGRKDSLWSQALEPLENKAEHAGNRVYYARITDQFYRDEYEAVFGILPDFSDTDRFPVNAGPSSDAEGQKAWQNMTPEDKDLVTSVFVNIGRAIAAYESKLQPAPGRFDRYVSSLLHPVPDTETPSLTADEIAGIRLFISEEKGQCLRCHNGPLLTNFDFQATSVPQNSVDTGRQEGIRKALKDEFNCLSKHNQSPANSCQELNYAKQSGIELERAFKVPTLRNIADTAPYMHEGQFETLEEVMRYYNHAAPAPGQHGELSPLRLFPHELKQITAFLKTLDGGIATEPQWLLNPFMEKGI